MSSVYDTVAFSFETLFVRSWSFSGETFEVTVTPTGKGGTKPANSYTPL